MSESTQAVLDQTESTYSDILDHLPPEVAEALGQNKGQGKGQGKSAKAPKAETPATETEEDDEEITEETPEEGTEQTEQTDEESSSKEDEDSKDSEDSEDPKNDGETEDKSTKKLEKRIDKLTRRRKEAETLAESLKTENEQLKADIEKRSVIKLEATPEDPLSDLDDVTELEAKVSAAKKVRAWALQNPDGATVTNADGTERYVDRAEMAKFIAQTDALLSDHAPARREYLRERAAILPEAKATYPALFKAGSEEHQVLVDTLRRVPSLKRLPGYELVIGDAITGMKLRHASAQSKSDTAKAATAKQSSAKTGARAIAPAIPKASASRPPAASTRAKSNELDRVLSSGRMDDLAAYFGG